ncbi:unnamed protein product, partial [Rotaria magnacalcarata]
MSRIKLNKNNTKYDERLEDSLNLAKLKIKSTGNATIISPNISHPEINILNKLQYDNKPLEPWEEGFEELDLPKVTEWSYESLSARLKIESVDDGIIKATKELLFKYKDVFSQTEFSAPCKLEPMNIDLTTDVPIYVKQYPMGKEIEDALYDIVMEMQKAGTVVKSNSKYNFPVLAVRKRDQKKAPTEGKIVADTTPSRPKIRLVIDSRRLNEISVADNFQLPRLDVLLRDLGSFKYFQSLDLANAFYQMELSPKSQDYFSFQLKGEKFKLTRSPMGHKSTPGYFQRNMNFALGDLLKPMVMEVDRIDNKGNKYTENVSATRTLVYLDDILASAESELVLLRVTELILERLQKYGLKLKIDKCTFSTKKLNFLGHVIDGKNVSKSSEYVDKIMQIPEPKTGKELLQFLGLCAWISKYTYNWTQIAYELIQYQKNDKLSMAAKLVWTDAMSECFKNIKTALKADVKLAYPLPEEESGKLHLYCDASTVSAASFLGQLQNTDELDDQGNPIKALRIIGCYSKILNSAQKNLSVLELELVSIRYAIKHFSIYIAGRNIIIYTDHHALQYLHRMKDFNGRLWRTSEELNRYNYEIQYIPGRDNYLSDALSRINFDTLSKQPIIRSEQLLPEGFRVCKIEGGPDSLCWALATAKSWHEIDKDERNRWAKVEKSEVILLREELVNEIRNNKTKYGISNEENRIQWNKYLCDQIELPDVFIQAYSNKYYTNIEIYFCNGVPILYKPFKPITDPPPVIRLQQKGIYHFNVISVLNKDNIGLTQPKDVMPQPSIDQIELNNEQVELNNKYLDKLTVNYLNDYWSENKSLKIEQAEPNINTNDKMIGIDKIWLNFGYDILHNYFDLTDNLINDKNIHIKFSDANMEPLEEINKVIEIEEISEALLIKTQSDEPILPRLKNICNHNLNIKSAGLCTMGLMDPYFCCIFDTCSSVNVMSESVANMLLKSNMITESAPTQVNIKGSQGSEEKRMVRWVYSQPMLEEEWSFHNTTFAVFKDEDCHFCMLFGMSFMATNLISLNYAERTVELNNVKLCPLGIYSKEKGYMDKTVHEWYETNNNLNFRNKNDINKPIKLVPEHRKIFESDLVNSMLKQIYLSKKFNISNYDDKTKIFLNKISDMETDHCFDYKNIEILGVNDEDFVDNLNINPNTSMPLEKLSKLQIEAEDNRLQNLRLIKKEQSEYIKSINIDNFDIVAHTKFVIEQAESFAKYNKIITYPEVSRRENKLKIQFSKELESLNTDKNLLYDSIIEDFKKQHAHKKLTNFQEMEELNLYIWKSNRLDYKQKITIMKMYFKIDKMDISNTFLKYINDLDELREQQSKDPELVMVAQSMNSGGGRWNIK